MGEIPGTPALLNSQGCEFSLRDCVNTITQLLHSNISRRQHVLPRLPNEEPVCRTKTKFYNRECLDRLYYNC